MENCTLQCAHNDYEVEEYNTQCLDCKQKNNHIPIWKENKTKMATLKEAAQAYEPPQTKNIADLDKIPIGIEVVQREGKNKDGEVFKYNAAIVEGQEYRIAGTILGGIKVLLVKFPTLKQVQVLKSGEGMATRYQVIPYEIPRENIITREETIPSG